MDLLSELISSFDPSRPNFRPTELYNESWLMKLVFHQASTIPDETFPLGSLPGSTWFSEALLPTAFKARYQGDLLSESRTNADGVIGHIRIGAKAKADLELELDAAQFTVVEAKVGSPLSKGTSNAKYFDQAARNVACMAEVIARAGRKPSSFDRLDFVVLAPQYSIEKGTFSDEMKRSSIEEKVKKRVDAYGDELKHVDAHGMELKRWFDQSFAPLMDVIELRALSWEDAIAWIREYKPGVADQLSEYYDLCLKFK
jgi:hypothetical protein